MFDRRLWTEAERVQGDRGARDLLAAHPEWIVSTNVEGEAPLDVDDWDDYGRVVGPD